MAENWNWNNSDMMGRFERLLTHFPPIGIGGRSVGDVRRWDEKADIWDQEYRNQEEKRRRDAERIAKTADFLRERGALTEGSRVLDIGCGPGRFVLEFAKTAARAEGLDLSPKMMEYAGRYAKEAGVTNVAFHTADFKALDIDGMGWRGAFDLVCASNTPAISTREDLDRAAAMSRKWCYVSSFLRCPDPLGERIAAEVYGTKPALRKTGSSAYALFNILWLEGYHPVVEYYDRKSFEVHPPSRQFAEMMVGRIGIPDEDGSETGKVYEYLKTITEDDGCLHYPYDSLYIWLLWDVNERDSRSAYEV